MEKMCLGIVVDLPAQPTQMYQDSNCTSKGFSPCQNSVLHFLMCMDPTVKPTFVHESVRQQVVGYSLADTGGSP